MALVHCPQKSNFGLESLRHGKRIERCLVLKSACSVKSLGMFGRCSGGVRGVFGLDRVSMFFLVFFSKHHRKCSGGVRGVFGGCSVCALPAV